MIRLNFQGLWGTVCDDYFGASEAKVVCRMLGFSDNDVSRAHIYDGERDLTATSGPIWIRFMNGSVPDNAVAQRCSGNENSLSQCHVSLVCDTLSLESTPFTVLLKYSLRVFLQLFHIFLHRT